MWARMHLALDLFLEDRRNVDLQEENVANNPPLFVRLGV